MKCSLKLNSQSVTHMQSFKEICDMVQNGYEDLERQTLKCPRSLPYSTGRYGNVLKLPSFKFSEAKNL